jgi:hypothetical protein
MGLKKTVLRCISLMQNTRASAIACCHTEAESQIGAKMFDGEP